MPSKSTILIASVILSCIALMAIIVAWRLRRKSSRKAGVPGSCPAEGTSSSTLPIIDRVRPKAAFPGVSAILQTTAPKTLSLQELALNILNADLRGCVQEIAERIREEGPDFDDDTSMSFVEEMVDRMDELAAMIRNQDGQATVALTSFREAIVGILSKCGAELIHSDTWDPTLQRAIAKEVTSGITAPSILRFGSTGFWRRGQLIRKQEVILATPGPH